MHTVHYNIWRHELELEAIRQGLDPADHLDRIRLWHAAGETLESARAMLRAFGEGKRKADRAGDGDLSVIRRANRTGRSNP